MSEAVDLRRILRQTLQAWQLSGVTHVPVSRAAAQPLLRTAAATPAPTTDKAEGRPASSLPVSSSVDSEMAKKSSRKEPSAPAANPVSREDRLEFLKRCVAECTRCEHLARTRTQTVFGVGNPQARVMFIGEAPGADEDARGEPFVGKAGQLLNRIIEACGWKREEVYICNILRCRPPDNRTPSPEEAQNCREFLDGQIAIVSPEYIVCWGACAAQNLLQVQDAIGKLRGRFFTHGAARVLCTYHPSYLLRNPAAKKPVWEDMKLLLAEMGLEPPAG